eukprot:208881-Ditylum_brightwellii.AAC.1
MTRNSICCDTERAHAPIIKGATNKGGAAEPNCCPTHKPLHHFSHSGKRAIEANNSTQSPRVGIKPLQKQGGKRQRSLCSAYYIVCIYAHCWRLGASLQLSYCNAVSANFTVIASQSGMKGFTSITMPVSDTTNTSLPTY